MAHLNPLTGQMEEDNQDAGAPPDAGVPTPPMPAAPPPAAIPPALLAAAGLPPPVIQPGLPSPLLTGAAATPAKSITGTDTTHGSSRVQISPEEERAHARTQATMGKQVGVIEDAGKLAVERARIEEDAAKKKVELQKATEVEVAKAHKDGVAKWQAAQDSYKAAQKQFEGAKPEEFFANDTTGLRRFFAGVAMALGGFNAGVNGGPNTGFQMIKESIDAHDSRERFRIGQLEKVMTRRGVDRDEIERRTDHELTQLTARKAAMFETADASVQARLKAMGVPEAQVRTNAAVLESQKETQLIDEQHLQAKRKTITEQTVTRVQDIIGGAGTGAKDKPIGDWKPEERKAEGFAMRAYKAGEEMDKLKYTPKDLAQIQNGALLEKVPNTAAAALERLRGNTYQNLSPAGKKLFNAQAEFVLSTQRPESGAAISLSEIQGANQRYGQVPGDTPEARGQKVKFRNSEIVALGMQSGRPQFWIGRTGAYDDAAPKAAPAAAPAKGKRGSVPGLGPGTMMPDGTFVPDGQVAQR
jgi:hypothetical protein